MSQVELAERLRISQANVSDYERGILRLHGDLIIELAKVLNVSADELLGLSAPPRRNGPGSPRLARYLSLIEQLPKRDRDALLRTINAFLDRSASQAA